MKYVAEVAKWLERHALWLLLMVIGAWTGAALIRRRNNAVSTVRSALSVEKAKERIASLRAEGANVTAIDQEKANQLLRVHSDIEQQRKAIAEIYNGKPWAEMSDEEVQAALRASGV
jgi:hypothetical protein